MVKKRSLGLPDDFLQGAIPKLRAFQKLVRFFHISSMVLSVVIMQSLTGNSWSKLSLRKKKRGKRKWHSFLLGQREEYQHKRKG
jgi:hypothetical protein